MDGDARITTPPIEAFRFFAPAAEVKAEVEGKRRFSGVAYSGEVVTGHHYWTAVIFDLSSTKAAERTPVLIDHDRSQRAGVTKLSISDRIVAEGELLPNTHGASLAADADAGFPWELSVHIQPGSIEKLEPGASAQVNGRTVTGPLHIFRNSQIRELSFTPTGADSGTSASVFSITSQEPAMDPNVTALQSQIDALKAQNEQFQAQITTLTAERDQFKADADAKAAEAAEAAATARKTEVATLFSQTGRTLSDDAAKPYLSMDATTFSAIATNERSLFKARHPSGLFEATATAPVTEGDGTDGTPPDETQQFAARIAATVNRPKGK
jgi:hypothetical protein